jgi:hypothetical protein
VDHVTQELSAEDLNLVSGGGMAEQFGAAVAIGLGIVTGKVIVEGPSCKMGEEPGPRPAPIPYPN